MNKNNIKIKIEEEKDFAEVENLVRESFWNVYRPGCTEHFVLNKMRCDKAFIKELSFVMLENDQIIGQNVFTKAEIKADNGANVPILTMGPICITPPLKRKGYGKLLLDYSLEKAKEMGFGAVFFEGNIDFYGKSGFTYAKDFNIRYHGLPEGEDSSFFLGKELKDGYLKNISGEYSTPKCYFAAEENKSEFEEYDKHFPHKEKLKLPGQIF